MVAKKAQRQPTGKAASAREPGKVLTVSQRLRDMRAHGEEVRQSKDSAVAFLQRAGILNNAGKLAKPYRG